MSDARLRTKSDSFNFQRWTRRHVLPSLALAGVCIVLASEWSLIYLAPAVAFVAQAVAHWFMGRDVGRRVRR